MVQRYEEERRMQEAVKRGLETQKLWPKVQNWCKHLKINLVSAGMLAEMHRLPIGRIGISCPHASSDGVQSHHLDQVAADFIPRHCRGCPHHAPLSLDNVGYTILEEYGKLSKQLTAEDPEPPKPNPDDPLIRELDIAIQKAATPTQSTLQLAALLYDPSQASSASAKLVEAATIAPELFDDVAIRVLCAHFSDKDHGAECMKCVRQLNIMQEAQLEYVWSSAVESLAARANMDAACAILGDQIEHRGILPTRRVVERILGAQYHVHHVGVRGSPSFPGSEQATNAIAKSSPDILVTLLTERLKRDDKIFRINAARIITRLAGSHPRVAEKLVDPLIASLELPDDPYEDSADGAARVAIREIYKCTPQFVQARISASIASLTGEAQGILVGIVDGIIEHSKESKWRGPADQHCSRAIPFIIPFLIDILSNPAYSIEAAFHASEALKRAAHLTPEVLMRYADPILGALALVTDREERLQERKPSNTLEQLQYSTDATKLGGATHRLTDAVEELAKHSPDFFLKQLRAIVPSLSSKQPGSARYKAKLTALYGVVGREPTFCATIIPDLYKLLLDFDSPRVRAAAIEAVGRIIEHIDDALPKNMRELVIAYLVDRYVVIHKTAARVVAHLKPADNDEASAALDGLCALYNAYESDLFFRLDIVKAVVNVCDSYPTTTAKWAGPLLVDLARTGEQYVADDALLILHRILADLPPTWQILYAKEVLGYLAKSHRDPMGYGGNRESLLASLYELPPADLAGLSNQIREIAIEKSKADMFDALNIAGLLSYGEQHGSAAELAALILKEQPKVKRNEYAVALARIVSGAYAAEASIVVGNTSQARAALDEAIELDREQNEKRKNSQSEDFGKTFILADRVARRTGGIPLG
jgi:hypothetical protein